MMFFLTFGHKRLPLNVLASKVTINTTLKNADIEVSPNFQAKFCYNFIPAKKKL